MGLSGGRDPCGRQISSGVSIGRLLRLVMPVPANPDPVAQFGVWKCDAQFGKGVRRASGPRTCQELPHFQCKRLSILHVEYPFATPR